MQSGLGLIQLILILSDLSPFSLILSAYMDLRPTGVCSRHLAQSDSFGGFINTQLYAIC